MKTTNQGPRIQNHLSTIIIYVLLFMVLALVLLPLLWAISSSFSPNAEIFKYTYPFSVGAFIPQKFTLEAYSNLFAQRDFGRALVNSLLLSTVSVIIGGAVNFLAGFAFARFDFWGKRVLFIIVIFTFMVPVEVTILPQFILMRDAGWLNTWQGLIVPGLANSMVIFLFQQFYVEFPQELLDAARVDGANWPRIIASIVLPISKPILIGAGLVLFLAAWNSFFWPLVVSPQPEFRVVQVAISLSIQERQTLWNELFAGSLLAAVVPVLLLLPLQRYFVKSIATTGLK